MARGKPDYSNPFYASGHPYADPAWLPLAVAGVASMDGAGRPVFMSDFRDGKGQWAFGESSLGYSLELTPGSAYSGLMSLRMSTGGLADGQVTVARKYLICPPSPRLGVEIAYLAFSTAPIVTVEAKWDDGVNSLYGRVKQNHTGHLGYIVTPTGDVYIDDWSGYSSIVAWQQLKLVVDFDAREYVRLLYAAERYDISGYSLTGTAPTQPAKFSVALTIEQDAAAAVEANFGLCIITTDEP